jgi:hypothetical protein
MASPPKITWGTSFANTLQFGWYGDSAVAYRKPRDGSIQVQAPSGTEDAWTVGVDYYLELDLRWIPTADGTNPTRTGWDGSTGVDAFLSWAADKNQFRFFPDGSSGTFITSYLVSPMGEAPQMEEDATKKVRLVMRNSGSAYTGY